MTQHLAAYCGRPQDHPAHLFARHRGAYQCPGAKPESAQPRHTVDTLTDPMLTTLYNERDMLGRETDRLRKDWVEMRTRAEKAEATLTAVRKLHAPVQYRRQTICGHCSGYGGDSCDNGTHLYPCPTITVLDQHGQTTA